MHLGNPNVRGAGESISYTPAMIEEYLKCKEDIIYFAEKYFYIITLDGGRQLIKLWDFQKKILKAFMKTPAFNGQEKKNLVILSSRQISKTTMITIYFLHYIIFNKDKCAAVLANKEEVAKEILRRIRFSYEQLPLWLQAGVADGGWNKKTIQLENGSRIICSSTASDGIRGYSINVLALDEFAFVDNNIAEEFMASVFPTISSGKESKIIICSTPNGKNAFYNIWQDAINGENNYFPIKVRWDEVPGRDENWKKMMIKDMGTLKFAQEFLAKFIGSISTLVDPDILERLQTKEPIEIKLEDKLFIYEKPIAGVLYVIGADTGKGIKKDYSCLQVLKITDIEHIDQVATYRNNEISPMEFSKVLISVAKYYGNAYVMIENNDVGSLVCNDVWHGHEYENMVNLGTTGVGVHVHKKNKLEACMLLKRYMEEGRLKIVDRRTIYELSRFSEIGLNTFRCPTDVHDDAVSALYIALYFVTTSYYENRDSAMYGSLEDDKYKLDDMPEPIFDYGGYDFYGQRLNDNDMHFNREYW